MVMSVLYICSKVNVRVGRIQYRNRLKKAQKVEYFSAVLGIK